MLPATASCPSRLSSVCRGTRAAIFGNPGQSVTADQNDRRRGGSSSLTRQLFESNPVRWYIIQSVGAPVMPNTLSFVIALGVRTRRITGAR